MKKISLIITLFLPILMTGCIIQSVALSRASKNKSDSQCEIESSAYVNDFDDARIYVHLSSGAYDRYQKFFSYNERYRSQYKKNESLRSAEGLFHERISNLEFIYYNHEDYYAVAIWKTDHPEKVALVFVGTRFNLTDWYTDIAQFASFETPYYTWALEIVDKVKSTFPSATITITGHSLGGGLAMAASLYSGLNAYVFNPAGLSRSTINFIERKIGKKVKNTGNIHVYVSKSPLYIDFVSSLAIADFSDLPFYSIIRNYEFGKTYIYGYIRFVPAFFSADPLDDHSISYQLSNIAGYISDYRHGKLDKNTLCPYVFGFDEKLD